MPDSNIILECGACGHLWAEHLKLPMAVEAAAARFKAMAICPQCARKRKTVMLLGDRYREAAAKLGIEPTGGEYGVPVPPKEGTHHG